MSVDQKEQAKERPILFSGPMVRAILEGRKTQTRRICKPQPDGYWDNATNTASRVYEPGYLPWWQLGGINHKCPYGKIGDRLWCKETYRLPICFDEDSPAKVGEKCIEAGYDRPWSPVKYAADEEELLASMVEDGFGGDWGKTRVSIHMPRWASRITLEITGVRVERLQDISEEDAIAEGSQCAGVPASLTNRGAFAKLWQSINGPESWAANPWVWVVEFKKVLQ